MTSRRHPPLHDEAGVTLVEVMIVLVVIAIGILALSAVQTRSSSDVYATGRSTKALTLAQMQMENARGSGFASVVPDSGVVDTYTWWTRVDSVSVDLKHVTVTVSWREKDVPRSLRLDNLVSDR